MDYLGLFFPLPEIFWGIMILAGGGTKSVIIIICCCVHITHHTAHTAQPTSHPEHHHCPRPRRPPLPHSSQSAGHAALMALSISTTECFLACLLTIFVCLGHDELEGELLLLGLNDQVARLARPAAHVLHLELLRLAPAAVKSAW